MKLLLVTAFYPSHAGGVEIVANYIAQELVSKGVKVTWSASDFDCREHDSKNLEFKPFKAFDFIEKKLSLPFPVINTKAIFQLYKSVKECDAVHIHDFLYMPNFVAWFSAKLQGKPVLITQHIGMIPYKNIFFRLILKFINRTIGIAMLKKSDQVVFISNQTKNYYEKISSKNILHWTYVSNGVDTNKFFPDKNRDPKYILYVGRFVEKKGLGFLEKLVRTMPEYDWIFVGEGPINPIKWNAPNVRVLKKLDHSDLVSVYHGAFLLVLPSVGEGFPLVIQESLACDVPVLTTPETANGSMAALNLIYTESISTETADKAWKRKIISIINTDKEIGGLSSFARKEWSWDSVGDNYFNMFKNITKKQMRMK